MTKIEIQAVPPADPSAAAAEAAAPKSTPESTTIEPVTPGVSVQKPGEIGGPRGPEPTRYGDWESKGRCTDF
ncbi:hypothetical protein N825_00275 [Skermanella stibiiresistens SB22]|uniref:DUF1674 domain-containing protein n=1 Tax=Skermanella stibiiresistens SB22 TaxID=1385369 RepID=W9HET5_9PROT|nr:succinate dehydrogenase assembly factor 4 [Skermanella stibiiresistens]EWY42418.1 hypothetical protein N825_00275 [Skermanella stibiiresistens SB22]